MLQALIIHMKGKLLRPIQLINMHCNELDTPQGKRICKISLPVDLDVITTRFG